MTFSFWFDISNAERSRSGGFSREKLNGGYPEINLARGELVRPFPQAVIEAMGRAQHMLEANRSVVGAGLPELREAIANRSNRQYGTECTPDQVVVTGGSGEAVEPVLGQFNPRTTTVLVADISYGDHVNQATKAGFKVVRYALDENFMPDVESIRQNIEAAGDALLVVTNPSNPSGSVYFEERLQEIAEIINRSPGAYAMADEVYDESVLDEDVTHTPLARLLPEKTFTVNGLSKKGVPGLRIGYVTAPRGNAG